MKRLIRPRNSNNVLSNESEFVIMGLFAFFAVMQVLSWTAAPILSATGRLSTSPIVVILCCIGIAAERVKDWEASRVISGIAVPEMAAGRFTFSILGGAPPFDGWNIYELRCVSELMMLIFIFALCMLRSTEDSHKGALTGRILMPFLTDIYDNPFFSLSKTRRLQIRMCVIAFVLLIVSGFRNSLFSIFIFCYIPFIIMLSGARNNKNFVGILMLVKTASDLGNTSFLQGEDMSAVFIALDVLAVIMAFIGRRENYSMVLIVQTIAVGSYLMLFCCSTVDRGSPYFYREAAAWGCELVTYINLLLFGYGRGWSSNSLLSLLRALLSPDECHPDDDWIEVQSEEDGLIMLK